MCVRLIMTIRKYRKTKRGVKEAGTLGIEEMKDLSQEVEKQHVSVIVISWYNNKRWKAGLIKSQTRSSSFMVRVPAN